MIFKLLKSSHMDSVLGILKSHESKDFERFGLGLSASHIDDLLSKGICFGLFEGERLAAFVLGRKVDQDIFEIDMTATNKDDLKKGNMQKLFKEMIAHLKSSGPFYKIWLEVHEENIGAVSFYLKVGFVENSKRPKYYPDGKAAILMTLAL